MRTIATLLLALASLSAFAQDEIDCKGSPKKAVLQLPAPVAQWGRVACTPWGHIIRSKDGWDWTTIGMPQPVFVPAQMVAEPSEVGNQAYFTDIKAARAQGAEYDAAYAAFSEGLDPDPRKPATWRVEVKASTGTAVKLYFFDFGDSVWGIWCGEQCAPQSRFMLLQARR